MVTAIEQQQLDRDHPWRWTYTPPAACRYIRWMCRRPSSELGCITVKLNGAVDWSQAQELWVSVDLREYGLASCLSTLFFESNRTWRLAPGCPVSLHDSEGNEIHTTAADDLYCFSLPPAFCGWIRVPLDVNRLTTNAWEPAQCCTAKALQHVSTLSFGLEQTAASSGNSARFHHFLINRRSWIAGDPPPAAAAGAPLAPGYTRVLDPDLLPAGMRLAEANDVRLIGQDRNRLAGYSFSAVVTDDPAAGLALLLPTGDVKLTVSGHPCVLPAGAAYRLDSGRTAWLSAAQETAFCLLVQATAENTGGPEADMPPAQRVLFPRDPLLAQTLARRLVQEWRRQPSPDRAGTYLRCLLWELEDPAAGGGNSLRVLRQEIYRRPATAPCVDEAAQRVHLSRSGFQHSWTRQFGRSYRDDVRDARLTLARRLLEQPAPLPLDTIARQCGYAGTSALSRQFTRAVGLSPAAYRRVQWKGGPSGRWTPV